MLFSATPVFGNSSVVDGFSAFCSEFGCLGVFTTSIAGTSRTGHP